METLLSEQFCRVRFWLVFTLPVRDLGNNIVHVFSNSILLFLHKNTFYLDWGLGPIHNSVNLISYFLDNLVYLSNIVDPVPVK